MIKELTMQEVAVCHGGVEYYTTTRTDALVLAILSTLFSVPLIYLLFPPATELKRIITTGVLSFVIGVITYKNQNGRKCIATEWDP